MPTRKVGKPDSGHASAQKNYGEILCSCVTLRALRSLSPYYVTSHEWSDAHMIAAHSAIVSKIYQDVLQDMKAKIAEDMAVDLQ